MAADGHDLRSRSLIGESVVSLQVPQERFAPICAWLRDCWVQRDCQTDTEPYSDTEVMGLRLTLPEGTISRCFYEEYRDQLLCLFQLV